MQSMPIPGYGACNPACVVGHGGPHEVGVDTVSPWVLVVGSCRLAMVLRGLEVCCWGLRVQGKVQHEVCCSMQQ
jgi:hypothetical protein